MACSLSSSLESSICRLHERTYCTLIGNATTGLVLAIKALGIKRKRIAIPSSVCINVPMAVLLSGNIPHFVDIELNHLCISLDQLSKIKSKIDAVICVHCYGRIGPLNSLVSFCKKEDLPLIEDCALAQGGTYMGIPVGRFGDISVISFGSGKIIDVGHGGAVLTSNFYLAEQIKTLASSLKHMSSGARSRLEMFQAYHTKLYNEAYPNRSMNSHCHQFKALTVKIGKSILCAFEDSYRALIYDGIENLATNIQKRRDNVGFLDELVLKHESSKVFLIGSNISLVPWRYNLFIEKRDLMLRKLLSKNMKVSSWYPSADLLFEERTKSNYNLNLSDFVGDRIINFWVNQDIDYSYLNALKQEIVDHLRLLEY